MLVNVWGETMDEKLKFAKIFCCEECYSCPYCGNTQGYTDCGFDEDDLKQIHFCNKCRKEFKIKR